MDNNIFYIIIFIIVIYFLFFRKTENFENENLALTELVTYINNAKYPSFIDFSAILNKHKNVSNNLANVTVYYDLLELKRRSSRPITTDDIKKIM